MWPVQAPMLPLLAADFALRALRGELRARAAEVVAPQGAAEALFLFTVSGVQTVCADQAPGLRLLALDCALQALGAVFLFVAVVTFRRRGAVVWHVPREAVCAKGKAHEE